MKRFASDTHPKAEAVYLRLMREATPAKRSALGRALSAATIARAREGLRRARPDASEREIDLWFVELTYGKDLAERVRKYLAEKGS